MPDPESLGLLTLFFTCFLSATLIPLSSEALFIWFITQHEFSPFVLILIAGAGNSIGGFINLILGFYGNKIKNRWFKPKGDPSRFSTKIQRYGSFCAFFSWLPIVGDPLLIALGFYRVPIISASIWMVSGKFLRYALLAFVIYQN